MAVALHETPRCPDLLGIGRADISPPLISLNGHPVWPPVEELDTFIPPLIGTVLPWIPETSASASAGCPYDAGHPAQNGFGPGRGNRHDLAVGY